MKLREGYFFQRRWQRLLVWGLLLGVASLIFALSAQDGGQSSVLTDGIAQGVVRFFDDGYSARSPEAQQAILEFAARIIRKMGHFCEYALLACLTRFLLEGYRWPHPSGCAWLICTLYAITDECHQLFVNARYGTVRDVLVDSAGAATGVLFAFVVLTLAARWQLNRSPKERS